MEQQKAAGRRTLKNAIMMAVFGAILFVLMMVVVVIANLVLTPVGVYYFAGAISAVLCGPFYRVLAHRVGKRGVLLFLCLLAGLLTPLQDRRPASLSRGEKQRVILAAACCSEAKLIVPDEPTGGLDTANARRVAQYMRQLAESGKMVLVITHDPLLVAMANGEVRITHNS